MQLKNKFISIFFDINFRLQTSEFGSEPGFLRRFRISSQNLRIPVSRGQKSTSILLDNWISIPPILICYDFLCLFFSSFYFIFGAESEFELSKSRLRQPGAKIQDMLISCLFIRHRDDVLLRSKNVRFHICFWNFFISCCVIHVLCLLFQCVFHVLFLEFHLCVISCVFSSNMIYFIVLQHVFHVFCLTIFFFYGNQRLKIRSYVQLYHE